MSGRVAVIIPVGPRETGPPGFLELLRSNDKSLQIYIAVSDNQAPDWLDCLDDDRQYRIVRAPAGRASQMNAAARASREPWFWFLHADSMIENRAVVNAVELAGSDGEAAIHYHDLVFDDAGPKAMKLNAAAVGFRSDWLKMPFGDQGFLMPRTLFDTVGGYDESVAYGEDHLLVWRARHAGFAIKPTGEAIVTSARKYSDRGWARTTAIHVWLTLRQAAPEFFRLIGVKLGLLRHVAR